MTNYLHRTDRLAVWPPDDTDPMWQFQLRPNGSVAVASRDGTNWIHMPRRDWDAVVAAMTPKESDEHA